MILPEEYKERAIVNGISLQTVYARLKRDWSLERACNERPLPESTPASVRLGLREETGMLESTGRPRGNVISFTPYTETERLLNEAIKESGKSRSVFIADAIEAYVLSIMIKPLYNREKQTEQEKTERD